jgi:hypothetical protein
VKAWTCAICGVDRATADERLAARGMRRVRKDAKDMRSGRVRARAGAG